MGEPQWLWCVFYYFKRCLCFWAENVMHSSGQIQFLVLLHLWSLPHLFYDHITAIHTWTGENATEIHWTSVICFWLHSCCCICSDHGCGCAVWIGEHELGTRSKQQATFVGCSGLSFSFSQWKTTSIRILRLNHKRSVCSTLTSRAKLRGGGQGGHPETFQSECFPQNWSFILTYEKKPKANL